MLTSSCRSKWQSYFPFSHQSSSQRLLYGVSGGSCPGLSCMSSMFPGGPLFVVLRITISGQPDILKMFVLVATGYLRPFPSQSYISRIVTDFLTTKSDWFILFQGFFKKPLFQGTKLVYQISIIASAWCCYRFYFFAENVFYIFILPLMLSYRANRCFKLIAWTTSNWEHLLEF